MLQVADDNRKDDENRKEERIPLEELPGSLHNVLFYTGIFEEAPGKTINASRGGMGIIAENIDISKIKKDQKITLKILPYNYKLKGSIVYTLPLGEKSCKFGLKFQDGKSLSLYHDLLDLDLYKEK